METTVVVVTGDNSSELTIRTEQLQDVCILHLIGELNVFNIPQAETAVSRIISNRRYNVVMNLSGLQYLDSSGIGFISATLKRLYEKGGDLKLSGLTSYVERVFRVLHFDYFLDIYEAQEEALSDFGANIAKAIFKWQKIVDMKPNYADAYYKLALAYRNSGMLKEAEEEVHRALNVNENYVEALNLYGELLLNAGNSDEAILIFQKILKIAPENLNGLLNLAICYNDMNMLDEAIQRFTETLELYPKYADLYYHLALAQMKKQNQELAIDNLEKAIALNPIYLEAHRLLARIYMERDDTEEALVSLKQIIDISLDQIEIEECTKNINMLRAVLEKSNINSSEPIHHSRRN
jgi:anti-anti-sigma factor